MKPFSITKFRQWEEDGKTYVECCVNGWFLKVYCDGNEKEDVDTILMMVKNSCRMAKYTGFRKKEDLNSASHNRSLHIGAQKIEIPEWDEALART